MKRLFDLPGWVLAGELDRGGSPGRRLGRLARGPSKTAFRWKRAYQLHRRHPLADSLRRPIDAGHLQRPRVRHRLAGKGITEQEQVFAVDAATGKELWQYKFNCFHTDVPNSRVGWAGLAVDPETGNVYANGVRDWSSASIATASCSGPNRRSSCTAASPVTAAEPTRRSSTKTG